MPHLVRAGQTLLRQVYERRDGVDANAIDVDGINRYRSIDFNTKTSKWLRPILEACADPRIKALDDGKRGHLIVRFVDTVAADDPSEFALDEADRVLNP